MDDNFFDSVYQVVRLIPHGRVTSYGAIGKYLGAPRSARMVGWAMNGAHGVSPTVPAHRVVNSKGLLTGKIHFSTPFAMEENLEKEGVEIKNDQVVNFKNVFWDPSEDLNLER
ncbi:MAG: MGMT family protein [Flavobacteriales bacterium]|jgi:methylated-DNA-protein-cysteine methyltransferase related protein|nr:MGMT family protein [Flavobacteriales bacterium]MBT3964720.1 MGMT family protein [Flavobacteriales bacterium]MBT4706051.1 MGMT family protein [Flavobacteriales bacterium]MBT4930702.1 MGMT family protein [Flavobacteriales bacterium]MBT5133382.1 MGMT family protein [Flavobacteriales bacterium]